MAFPSLASLARLCFLLLASSPPLSAGVRKQPSDSDPETLSVSCATRGIGRATLERVCSSEMGWFRRLFTMNQSKMRFSAPRVSYNYDNIRVRGAWRVRSDLDSRRFKEMCSNMPSSSMLLINTSQAASLDKANKTLGTLNMDETEPPLKHRGLRASEVITSEAASLDKANKTVGTLNMDETEPPLKHRGLHASELITSEAKVNASGVEHLDTAMQRLAKSSLGYPDGFGEVGSQSMTYLLLSTSPENLSEQLCRGLNASHSSPRCSFGRGVYLGDEVDMIDVGAGHDCDGSESGKCSYIIDEYDPDFKEVDRQYAVHYALVVLVSPATVVHTICLDTEGARSYFFRDPARSEWLNTFDESNNPLLRHGHLRDRFLTQKVLSSDKHAQVLKSAKKNFQLPNSTGCLKSHDEYIIHDPGHTRIDFVVAYQRECLGLHCDSIPTGEHIMPRLQPSTSTTTTPPGIPATSSQLGRNAASLMNGASFWSVMLAVVFHFSS
eukprot:TRINITY_DN5054_c0_g1_i2.p1 TRINITY_DN5054_c0_g1~~TRINITY_DN5054_c0_g1_i2.p1  ORF type:complete len:496 (+),score=73.73 TRINITY_DN5054_c0_g1_i2:85-1572(+)